jgi:hypothetical protein
MDARPGSKNSGRKAYSPLPARRLHRGDDFLIKHCLPRRERR